MRIKGAFTVRWAAQDGKQGKGATYIDLENENDSMLYDGLGNIVGGVNGYLYSACHLYSDGQEVSPVTFVMHEKSSGVTGSVINGNTIRITGITTDTGYFTVKCTFDGETFYGKMTIKRIVGIDKYEIVPDYGVISYNTSTQIPNTYRLLVSVYRTAQNGTRTNIGSLPSGFSLSCRNAEISTQYGVSGSYAIVDIRTSLSNPSIEGVYISLSKNGVNCDEEYVPINRYSNGSSVLAQFSTGSDGQGNWNWHSPYVIGDIWMRTSDDGGVTWTDALRCVGESGTNGAYTNYKFAISSALVTPSPTIEPFILGTWTDAPVATTRACPYLWMKIQKYNGDGTANGSPTYIRLTGEKGQSGTSVSIVGRVDDYITSIPQGTSHIDTPVYATENPLGVTEWDESQHDWVSVTPNVGDGYIVNDQNGNRLSDDFQGHLLVFNSSGWTDAGIIKGDNGESSYLHIAYANSADGSVGFTTDDSQADGHAYIGTYIDNIPYDSETYSDYTWVRVKGENGIVYDIVPSVFSIRADHNGSVLTGAIEVIAYRTDGETRSSNLLGLALSEGEDYYYAQYSIDGGTWTSCTEITLGSGILTQRAYGIPANKVSTATRGIALRLKHSSDNNKVLKTIPEIQVIKNGGQGEQGIEGCIIRKTQWQTGIYYCNDKNDTTKAYRYIDIAIIQGSTPTSFEAFMCRVSHLSSLENAPVSGQTTTEWEKLGVTTPMYTPLLLADYASITFAQTNRILVFKADGETVAAGMGGAEGGNDDNPDYPLWVGATYQERANAPFRVNLAGKLFATNAEISGKIDASTGSIGGFDIVDYNIKTKGNTYFIENKRGIRLKAYGESQIGCLVTRYNSSNDYGINIQGWLTVADQLTLSGKALLFGGLRLSSGSISNDGTISNDTSILVITPSENNQVYYLPRTYGSVAEDAYTRFLFIINNSNKTPYIQRKDVNYSGGYHKLRWKGTDYDKLRIGSWTSVLLVYTGGVWNVMNVDNNIMMFNY